MKKTKVQKAVKRPKPEPSSSLPSYEGEAYDKLLHSWMGKFSGWQSPASFGMAMFDWLAHLAILPAKQLDLSKKALEKLYFLTVYICRDLGVDPLKECVPCQQPRSDDFRFRNELWQRHPFDFYVQAFLHCERWWDEATCTIRGVSKHHREVVSFITRQMLDMNSPSNFPMTNPEVIAETIKRKGANFVDGYKNLLEDLYRRNAGLPPAGAEQYKVGVNLAITPGKVIYRNRLIELIQYESVTNKVYPEPILIIPAWIMKYYILDLSAHNSLVKYLVEQGHTVFMISWKNPGSEDRDLGMDEYVDLGIMHALDVIEAIIPNKKIHGAGYCLGGTLLMIAAAYMAGRKDERWKSLTLFAAQVDFKDSGELSLFVDQSQITFLEDAMWEKGYLDGKQMAWTFSMLRSNEQIWSRMIHDYLLGKRMPINDLIAWDYDTTRLPYHMHSEYLHNLFLNNELSQGRYKVGRKRIALIDINAPIFVVSTVKDHVSPWRSVYKINLFTDTDITFVLTSGGHNAGIVSEPFHPNRNFQIETRKRGDKYISADTWQDKSPHQEGSWWPEWEQWLANLSGKKNSPPPIGNAKKDYEIICDAPGTYVLED